MAGKIEYALGLTTGGFLGPLNNSRAALAAFGAAAAGFGGAMAGVFAEINRGADLKDLSNRTAESVQNLFQLQFAFEQSGVAAGSVAAVLQKYRQALSGVGEGGESTAEAFAAIGLSIEDLKNLDAPAALEKIFEGINKVDRNTGAGAAGKIFGRGAAGDILQLARDSADFAEALKEAAAQGAQLQRMAGVFDNIGQQIGRLKLQVRGVFLDLASAVGPAINGLLSSLADRDFKTLGTIAQLSLTVAFEKSVDFLANALVKLFAALPRMMLAGFQVGVAANAAAFAPLVKALGPHLGSALGLVPGGPMLNALTKDKQVAGANFVGDVLKIAAGDAMKQAGENIVKGFQNGAGVGTFSLFGKGNQEALVAALAGFSDVAAGAVPDLGGLAANNSPLAGGTGNLLQANALERVGALFGSGAGTNLTDYTRQTAINSRETVRLLGDISRAVGKPDREANFLNR